MIRQVAEILIRQPVGAPAQFEVADHAGGPRQRSCQFTISYGSVVITVLYQVEWDMKPEMKLNG